MNDDTNDYVLDLAACGHARPRYKTNIDCQECVLGRQRNNMLAREEKCRECKKTLNLDNTSIYNTGMICRDCKNEHTKEIIEKNHSYDVECVDCGETYKKRLKKAQPKGANSMCLNHLQEVNATCKVICQNTIEIGGVTMRCRAKRWARLRGDKEVIDSKMCGRKNKCLSLRQDKGCWFVCRTTSEDLTMCEDVSSKNYEGDLKWAAV
jgi:Zn ribbon nucleic-acid-binding protein